MLKGSSPTITIAVMIFRCRLPDRHSFILVTSWQTPGYHCRLGRRSMSRKGNIEASSKLGVVVYRISGAGVENIRRLAGRGFTDFADGLRHGREKIQSTRHDAGTCAG